MSASAIIVSLGMITLTDNRKSIVAFQQLATAAGLKDKNGQPLQVISLLPQLNPLFTQYNTGELSTEQFIKAFQEILPLSPEGIKEAWGAMCVVDDQALETFGEIARINASGKGESDKKSASEVIYIYSDTNPMHLEKILAEIASKRPSLGKFKVFTTFQKKLKKPDLLLHIVDQIKEDGYKTYILVIGENGVEDKLLKEKIQERDKAILENADRLAMEVHGIKTTRLTAEALSKIHKPTPKKGSINPGPGEPVGQSPVSEYYLPGYIAFQSGSQALSSSSPASPAVPGQLVTLLPSQKAEGDALSAGSKAEQKPDAKRQGLG